LEILLLRILSYSSTKHFLFWNYWSHQKIGLW
jgi:hypothetical protein